MCVKILQLALRYVRLCCAEDDIDAPECRKNSRHVGRGSQNMGLSPYPFFASLWAPTATVAGATGAGAGCPKPLFGASFPVSVCDEIKTQMMQEDRSSPDEMQQMSMLA
jgi:hypothetical protein